MNLVIISGTRESVTISELYTGKGDTEVSMAQLHSVGVFALPVIISDYFFIVKDAPSLFLSLSPEILG
jgi:hypothetical protein